MKRFFRSIAMIPNRFTDRDQWLCAWDGNHDCYNFIMGERLETESFRECVERETCWVLGLERRDILVANMAQVNLEYQDVLPGETDPSHIAVAFYSIHLYGKNARQVVREFTEGAWLSRPELTNGRAEDGRIVSPVLTYLLQKADVIPKC